jgi:AbrB family looped-hinge helix DNA binding protein
MSEVVVSDGGRVVIPAELRAKLGISVGDRLVWREDGDRLILTTRVAAIRRAQALVARYNNKPEVSMVDELIRERRAEAARE